MEGDKTLVNNHTMTKNSNVHTPDVEKNSLTSTTHTLRASADRGDAGNAYGVENSETISGSSSQASQSPTVHTEASTSHVKSRKRFSKNDEEEHKTSIINAIQSKKSLAMLCQELGLSKTKFKNYVADLALEGKLILDGYVDNVVPLNKLIKSLTKALDIKDEEGVLFQLSTQENGILVTCVSHNLTFTSPKISNGSKGDHL